jgi:hypothetical protein
VVNMASASVVGALDMNDNAVSMYAVEREILDSRCGMVGVCIPSAYAV